jgi:predicted permease
MSWLRNLGFRKRAQADLQEEIQQHVSERTAALIEQGRAPEEAAREARHAFGNITLARERSVEVWQWRWLENRWADLRFALHQLRKSPGYTLTAILTLAIGIGANAAIFTLIDDIMLRSLPVSHPEQLVEIGYRSPSASALINGQSIRTFTYLREHTAGLSDLFLWGGDVVFIPDDRGTLRSIDCTFVTGYALSMLGIRPYLGRLLTPADDVAGGPEGGWPVVLDYGFWLANYHGDPEIIGKHITISSRTAIIVGVLQPSFTGLLVGDREQLYLPMHFASEIAPSPDQDPYKHTDRFFGFAIGRLRRGVSLSTLNAELAAQSPSVMHALISPAMLASPRLHNATLAAQSARRGLSFLESDYRQPLFLLQGIVLLVLLLCCINLGGLQLARVQARQHEFAVRSALGAGRGRLLQQCLTESLLLALTGSLLAAGIAWYSTASLGAFLTAAGSGESMILPPDTRVLLVTTVLALITTLLFGLLPAWIAGRTSPGTLLKSQGVQQRANTLPRRIFIPAQFALALVLVLGAGLFSQTLLRLRSNHAGFNPAHIMMVTTQFQALKKTPAEIATLYRSMSADLRNEPGVQSAAYGWVTPLSGFAPKAVAQSHIDHSLTFNEVSDGYFSTMGTRLLAGREFTPDDRDHSTCIVNQSAARTLFAGAVLGNTLKASYDRNNKNLHDVCRIVGLVEDAHYSSLRDPAPPTLYLPAVAATFGDGTFTNNLVFTIRAHTDAEAIAAYRATLARFAPNTGVMSFLPLRDQVDQSLGSERLIAILSTTFAAIALLLSAIGIFGLLALHVQQRTPEFGVRIAVGATRSHLLRMIFSEALQMVAIGSVCGLALASIGYVFIRRFLYGTSPADISVALAALLVLILVALVAAAIPARRAAWLDPTQALRSE